METEKEIYSSGGLCNVWDNAKVTIKLKDDTNVGR